MYVYNRHWRLRSADRCLFTANLYSVAHHGPLLFPYFILFFFKYNVL